MVGIVRSVIFRMLGIAGLMVVATLAVAAEHEHGHETGDTGTGQVVRPGGVWMTDEVVRQGMAHIRQAMAARQEDIEKGRLESQDYRRLAEVVDQDVAAIMKNCKLPREADKAFHDVVLVDLIDGAELMRTSTKTPAQRVGALGVLQALRNYGKYFQHPGWQ